MIANRLENNNLNLVNFDENGYFQGYVSMSMKIVPLLLTKSVPVKYKNF